MILNEKVNLSLQFLLPLIAKSGENWTDYTAKYDMSDKENAFINGYYSDINRPFFDRHIFLMFDANIPCKLNFDNIFSNENFTKEYTAKINGVFYNIFALKIPDSYVSDYKLICSGNYSMISEKAKKQILSFWLKSDKCELYSALHHTGAKELFKSFNDEYIHEMDYIEDDLEALE